MFVFFLGLYAHKYEEEFQPYMQQFVTAVWNLLMNHGAEVKYDLLTSNAIQVHSLRVQVNSKLSSPNIIFMVVYHVFTKEN